MRNAGLEETQAGIKIAGRNIDNLRDAGVSSYGRKRRGTKEPLDEKWEQSEKPGLKLNIQKTKIMASGPISSWQIDVETVTDFIFWPPKSLQMVTAAMKLKDACSLEKKLLPT